MKARKQLSDASSAASSKKDSMNISPIRTMFYFYSLFVLSSSHKDTPWFRAARNIAVGSRTWPQNETMFSFYPIVYYGEITKVLRNFSENFILVDYSGL